MKLPKFDPSSLRRFLLALAAVLLTLAVLVLVPLLTHREPTPEPRFTEHRPAPSPTPTPTEIPLPTDMPNPNLPDRDEALQTLLSEFTARHPGTWDLYVSDLTRGQYASLCTEEDTPMRSASLIKLFIMGATFRQIQAEELRYWENYSTMCRMIVISDNYSANLLIGRLGAGDVEEGFRYVNAFADSIGCGSTSLNRLMQDENSTEDNYTSAEDCAAFLRMLYRLELVSPEYSSAMLDILKAQTVNDRIPAGLPAGTVCAHKTGDLEGICCADAGLVFSPGADYVLSVIANDPEDDSAAADAIAELSALIYEYFNPPVAETPPPGPSEP